MDLAEVVISPRVTEKSVALSSQKKYTLLVHLKASKNQIKEALKKNYKVDVIKINIIKVKPRKKVTPTKMGLLIRQKRAYKKAIVVLKKDQKIPGFEAEK